LAAIGSNGDILLETPAGITHISSQIAATILVGIPDPKVNRREGAFDDGTIE
jgi:hypothetical protein